MRQVYLFIYRKALSWLNWLPWRTFSLFLRSTTGIREGVGLFLFSWAKMERCRKFGRKANIKESIVYSMRFPLKFKTNDGKSHGAKWTLIHMTSSFSVTPSSPTWPNFNCKRNRMFPSVSALGWWRAPRPCRLLETVNVVVEISAIGCMMAELVEVFTLVCRYPWHDPRESGPWLNERFC